MKNHDPVKLAGDLYFIEGFKKISSTSNTRVVLIRKVFNYKYSKRIPVEAAYLEKLSEKELQAFREKEKR